MKLLKFSILALMLFFTTTTFAQKEIPATDIKTLDGQTVNLKDYTGKGKITVISLWATWCKPCQKELDAIADLYPDWQEEYDMELLAITIDTQRALGKVKPLIETKGWEYTVLSDPNNQLRNALNFQSIPHTFLLDKEGNIVYEHSGYLPGDEYELEDKIKALAGK